MEAFVVIWLICGLIGAMIGSSKGKTGSGFVLGILLGIIGLIIAVFMKPAGEADRRPCPHCAEQIMNAATVCPHCSRDVEPVVTPPKPVPKQYDGT